MNHVLMNHILFMVTTEDLHHDLRMAPNGQSVIDDGHPSKAPPFSLGRSICIPSKNHHLAQEYGAFLSHRATPKSSSIFPIGIGHEIDHVF